MTLTFPLTGRDIALAARATRAVLDRQLAASGTTFPQWVALGLIAGAASGLDPEQLVRQMTGGLGLDRSAVLATVRELVHRELVTGGPAAEALRLTPAGRRWVQQVSPGVDGITERLYRGLPEDELAIAHRVLAVLTERANAELAR